MSSKQRMLEQAYILFCEHGENFSLSQVTGVLGIKKQSIYNYFSGKDELIIEMLNGKIDEYYYNSKSTFDKFSELDYKECLYRMGEFTISEFEDQNRLKFRKWLSMSLHTEGISELKDILTCNEAKYRAMIIDIIERAMADGTIKSTDVQFMVTAYIVLVRGIVDGMFTVENYEYSQEFFKKMFGNYWDAFTREK